MSLVDVEESLILPIIKVALDEDLMISISYSSNDNEVNVCYQFVGIKKSDIEENLVKCVSYTSTKEDPLKLYGTVKSIEDFLEYIESPKTSNHELVYNKKTIKFYPKDWYECFETQPLLRIKTIVDKMPHLIEKAKNVIIVPKPKPGVWSDTIWAMDKDLSNSQLSPRREIRAEDKKMMDSLLATSEQILAIKDKGLSPKNISTSNFRVLGQTSIRNGRLLKSDKSRVNGYTLSANGELIPIFDDTDIVKK